MIIYMARQREKDIQCTSPAWTSRRPSWQSQSMLRTLPEIQTSMGGSQRHFYVKWQGCKGTRPSKKKVESKFQFTRCIRQGRAALWLKLATQSPCNVRTRMDEKNDGSFILARVKVEAIRAAALCGLTTTGLSHSKGTYGTDDEGRNRGSREMGSGTETFKFVVVEHLCWRKKGGHVRVSTSFPLKKVSINWKHLPPTG